MIFGLEYWALAVAVAAYFLGGYVKGALGFALPLVAVAVSAAALDAKTAVAAIILPVLLANLVQSLRQGVGPLLETARRFWPPILVLAVVITLSAQLLIVIEDRVFFLTLGAAVALFAGLQLAGWTPRIRPEHERPWGLGVGVLSGFYGGLAGIWGPPFILYLSALGLPKQDYVRAAGLCFFVGALVLAPAHLATGVLNAQTIPLSLAMIAPAMLGQYFGQKTQDRLDPALFRRITLIVLMLSALNLLRRAVF